MDPRHVRDPTRDPRKVRDISDAHRRPASAPVRRDSGGSGSFASSAKTRPTSAKMTRQECLALSAAAAAEEPASWECEACLGANEPKTSVCKICGCTSAAQQERFRENATASEAAGGLVPSSSAAGGLGLSAATLGDVLRDVFVETPTAKSSSAPAKASPVSSPMSMVARLERLEGLVFKAVAARQHAEAEAAKRLAQLKQVEKNMTEEIAQLQNVLDRTSKELAETDDSCDNLRRQAVSQEVALAQARREVAAKNGLVTTLTSEVTALQVALRKQATALDEAAGPQSVEVRMGRVEGVIAREVSQMQGEYAAKEAAMQAKMDQVTREQLCNPLSALISEPSVDIVMPPLVGGSYSDDGSQCTNTDLQLGRDSFAGSCYHNTDSNSRRLCSARSGAS